MAHHPMTTGLNGNVLAGILAVAMLVPTAIVLWPNVPLTARPVALPRWFSAVGVTLPPGKVVLTYPLPFSGLQSSQAWQAVDHMQWAQAGGGGPEGQPSRAGRARAGFEVLLDASLPLGVAPVPSRSALAAIRGALRQWRVTTIVIPDQTDLPLYEQGRSTAYAVGLFTAAMGRRPAYTDSAWVWSAPAQTAVPIVMTDRSFDNCVTGTPSMTSSPQAVSSCVLRSDG
jgi:hypothetical protein